MVRKTSDDQSTQEPDADFSFTMDETATPAWRLRAVKLAFERGLAGQALSTPQPGLYTCVSASSPRDYAVRFAPQAGVIMCECEAGRRSRPCAHAGAVLLLITRLAPERGRDETGAPR